MIDDRRAVDVVYMDYINTFDKVPHGKLIQNIKLHGIHNELTIWIQNCLAIDNRR